MKIERRGVPAFRIAYLLLTGISLATASLTPSPVQAVDTTWTFNGDGNWNVPGNWSAGVPNNNTFNAFIDDGDTAVTVNFNVNTTIGTLSIGADDELSFADTFDLVVAGASIVNNGLISLNAAGVINFNTDLSISAAQTTLSGSGTLLLGGVQQNRVLGSVSTNELINSATHTISGGGQLGTNLLRLTNQGDIDANISGMTITVDPSASGAANTGTMKASNGGILHLQGGVYTNTGGFIRALTGSVVELTGGSGASGTTVIGGTLASEGTGVIRTVGGDGGVTLQDVTLTSGSQLEFGANLDANIAGTITNNAAVLQQSSGPGSGQINIVGNTTLSGTGVWTMNNHANNALRAATNGQTLTNDTQHTIQGSGDIGAFTALLINNGTIIANQPTQLQISSPNVSTVTNTGTLRATNGATLSVNLGVVSSIDNQGTVEALNGSSVTYQLSAAAANNMAGVLTGGTWRSVATGGGATVTLRGSNITQIAAATTVELSGAGSVLQVVATPIDSTLTTNNGTLKIFDGRNFAMTAALTNSGTVELGGAGLAGGTLNSGGNITNAASGVIAGHGTISDTILNSGTVRAAGGTLVMAGLIDGQSGTVQVDPGATLDLSGTGGASDADFLIHNGAGLNLGANNFSVGKDYNNANFGVGNMFNARANVTGAGQINANPGVTQTLGGNVTNGGTATATMAFGNVHVGDAPTLNYQINNVGASGPSLRGAIQTSVGGASLTDARLGGAGVTASNFGPIATGANSGNLGVTFNATSAGALTSQSVRIANNFDNVGEQKLNITGAAFRLASPSAHTPEPVNFGIIHVGDVVSQALSITNNAANDGFSERLNASIGSPTGNATTNAGSFSGLAPGSTNSTSLAVGVNTATAGAKSGTATISLTSTGVGTSGLANTALASQTVNVQAQVNNFAVANVAKLSGDGSFSMTGVDQFTLDLGTTFEGLADLSAELGVSNTAAAPADSLAGSFVLAAPDFNLSGFGAFTNVAAGTTHGGLNITLDTATPGDFAGQITVQPQSTNSRPFSMDLAPITILLTGTIRLAGDFNDDGGVDAADYSLWRDTLGSTTNLLADGNGSGAIDSGDYNVWAANFGRTAPGSGTLATVPEPGTLALAIFVSAVLFWRRSCAARGATLHCF